MMLTKDNFEEWSDMISKALIKRFGKDNFTEDEMTKEFYVELKIGFSEFFMTESGSFDDEMLWSDGLKRWLMSENKRI